MEQGGELNIKKENQRKRNTHLKRKPKPKESPAPAPTPASAPPVKTHVDVPLPNNWARYELESEDDHLDEIEGEDFESLLNQPLSTDSHFKFKSEATWDSNFELQPQFIKYFTLDLKMLSTGIECVAFNERHDCDIFTKSNIDSMQRNVETNLKLYKKLLENKSKCKKPTVSQADIKREEIPDVIENMADVKLQDAEDIVEDDVEDLLKLKNVQINEEPPATVEDPFLEVEPPTIKVESDNLEQWLDDLLDD